MDSSREFPPVRMGGSLSGFDLRRRRSRKMTKVFKALSDSTRQDILRLLEDEQRCVGEIVGEFELSQPTISRHLSVLKEADLVIDQRRGQHVVYRLNDEALTDSMRSFFGQFRSCQDSLRPGPGGHPGAGPSRSRESDRREMMESLRPPMRGPSP